MKKCPNCGLTKPLSEYYRRPERNSVRPRCKECSKADAKPKRKAWYERNRARAIETSRQWSLRNPERRKANLRRWQLQNLDHFILHAHRRRAQKLGAESSLTKEHVLAKMQKQSGLCVYCSKDIRSKFTIDHIIPLSRGGNHTDKNVQLLCAPCNSSKWAKMPEEFEKERSQHEPVRSGKSEVREEEAKDVA